MIKYLRASENSTSQLRVSSGCPIMYEIRGVYTEKSKGTIFSRMHRVGWLVVLGLTAL